MHIILLILKIIGIVLLSLIGVFLVLILLGVFVPFRYNIKGEKEKEKPFEADVRVNWLFHIVSFTLNYKEKLSYRLRIFGFTVMKGEEDFSTEEDSSSKEDKQQGPSDKKVKKKQKSSEQEAKGNGEAVLKENDTNNTSLKITKKSIESEAENKTQENASKLEINETETGKTRIGNLWERIRQFVIDRWKKAKDLFYKAKQFCIDLYKKKDQAVKMFGIIKDFFCAAENKAGISTLWMLAKKFGRHCSPKKWDYKVRFGAGDPAQTGQILGVVSSVGGMIGIMPNIIPEFQEEVLEGNVFLKGRIQIYYLIWVVVELLRNEDFCKLKYNFEKVRRNLDGRK